MIVVSDAGPLIALAKVEALDVLPALFSSAVLTPPAVHQEAIEAGLAAGAFDARAIDARYRAGELAIRAPTAALLPVAIPLGKGEAESIRLAIETDATWLLIDDLDARRGAERCFEAAGIGTAVKGTLGILASAAMARHITYARATDLVSAIKGRPDIWVHPALCDRVIAFLSASARR